MDDSRLINATQLAVFLKASNSVLVSMEESILALSGQLQKELAAFSCAEFHSGLIRFMVPIVKDYYYIYTFFVWDNQ